MINFYDSQNHENILFNMFLFQFFSSFFNCSETHNVFLKFFFSKFYATNGGEFSSSKNQSIIVFKFSIIIILILQYKPSIELLSTLYQEIRKIIFIFSKEVYLKYFDVLGCFSASKSGSLLTR